MRNVPVVLATLLVTMMVSPVAAQEDTTSGPYQSVTVVPGDGVTLSWADRHYAGSLEVASASDGLVMLDHVGVDDYLLGIQEVPFSWPTAALKAQAVAARTYLAWTLQRGRAGAGATYGFDICASTACQVYGGLDQVASPSGQRWEAAVESTSGEVLKYEGKPALAMYSSTTGGRTRNYEDVYPGRSPIPYLRAVPSPGEDSSFAEWRYEVRSSILEDVLREAGLIQGSLGDIVTTETEDGGGPWTVEIRSEGETTSFTAGEFQGAMNRWGAQVHPEVFPAFRPDGARYPQTILSPTFRVFKEWHFPDSFRSGYIDVYPVYVVEGNGWGHMVGMSQYGARAMAEAGIGYGQILSHYYSGLVPEPANGALPDAIVVGLDWKEQTLRISADGPVGIVVDGQTFAVDAIGSWGFTYKGGVMLTPPEGFGLPPTVRDLPEMVTGASGRSLLVSVTVTAPAQVRLVVFRGAQVVTETPWKTREAGPVSLIWDGTLAGDTAPPGPYRLMIEARNSEGAVTAFVTALLAD